MIEVIKALNSFKQDLKDIKTSIDRIVKPAPHPLSGAWLDGQGCDDSKTLPVTIKYPEFVAEMFLHFEGHEIPTFGKDNL
jgi:hypothetical protein